MQIVINNFPVETLQALVLNCPDVRKVIEPAAVLQPAGGLAFPRIGEYWPGQGGKFAGIMRGRDGGPDYFLIKGPSFPNSMNFKDGSEKAAAVEVDGHKDFRMPFRKEQSLLFANLADEFEKKYYWSCERHPGFEDSAFIQDFSDGRQYWDSVNDKFLVCAVRIVPIQ